VEVEALGPGDDEKVVRAAHLFDDPVDAAAVRAYLADPRHHLLVASVDHTSAGFVTAIELLHPDKERPEMFIYELGVDERFRRRGVATALLERLFELTRDDERRGYTLEVRVSNDSAIKLYERLGFEARGIRRGYYTDNREDALIMWRDARPS